MNRLAELGILEKDGSDGIHTYRRSKAYLEWRVLLYIGEEYSMDEIIDRVEALEDRMGQLSGQTGMVPAILTASDVKSFEHIGPKMRAANELEQVKRRIRLFELARQIKQNEGHFGFDPIGFWL